ncbi:MAG: kelch repeat-containing protein [Promethearchaeota archaeon]
MKKRPIQAVLIVALIVTMMQIPVSGQDVEWENKNPPMSPLARRGAGMAYDSNSDLVVLFSGRNLDLPSPYGDTWTYDVDTNTWDNVTPDVSPPPREMMGELRGVYGFEYDSVADRVIFFGGVRQLDPFVCWNDTWAFDCETQTWENKTPAVSPRGTTHHDMAFDGGSGVSVLYGGMCDNRVASAETWSFNYGTNTWTNMSPPVNPGALYGFAMAYDGESDRIILFGGWDATLGEDRNQTWAYDVDTNSWTNMNPPVAPSKRGRFRMTYHTGWDRVVLFGGDAHDPSTFYSDTWLYDYNTNTWTELTLETHPSSRVYAGLTYDGESESVILFGGLYSDDTVFGDTWVLSGSIPTTTPPPIIDVYGLILIGASAVVIIIVLVVFIRRR